MLWEGGQTHERISPPKKTHEVTRYHNPHWYFRIIQKNKKYINGILHYVQYILFLHKYRHVHRGLGDCDCAGLLCRHLHCGVVGSVDLVVAHRAADQDLHALREVVEFGRQQEIVYESCCHASAHGPHPVHLQQSHSDQSLDQALGNASRM